ncbi:hypothetical protein ACFQHV_01075 [Promicromonospora thailandica]|uniref:Uncharacterized protein n=1 Tax=Promicromonospora thailandica TaxID=765201 RepID=A0A9X2G9C4_9MICO|nr:hypothetical protein [Promicromonospora thailandica]MCP2265554.1 hypothetical protein [Promicromonospora thailandica]BFF17119.1 hypothetical protein GCM10025730_06400 [Promicromonospora thailandica]
MSRPAHIAPLDDALNEQLAAFEEGNRTLARVLDENIVELDRLEAELKAVRQRIDDAASARVEAYHGARHCEEAIVKLGYVVLAAPGSGRGVIGKGRSRLDGLTYNLQDDYRNARIRAGLIKSEDDW